MTPPNAVRLEELVNYFPDRDKAPEGNDPFAPRERAAGLGLARGGLRAGRPPVVGNVSHAKQRDQASRGRPGAAR